NQLFLVKVSLLLLLWAMLLTPRGFAGENSCTKGFLPNTLPQDFTYSLGPEFYGTYEHKGKNGTIYNYINGGGEVYITHGFRSVAHMVLKNKAGDSITCDIYDMQTPKNSTAAYKNHAICPEGFKTKDIGTNAKSYLYAPDYILHFTKGKYLVTLSTNNDQLAETVNTFAKTLYKQ
ncbi:MAG: hypothetical protein GY765_26300, partial [bacterium]|nr:hypothetical protein [bacterium]